MSTIISKWPGIVLAIMFFLVWVNIYQVFAIGYYGVTFGDVLMIPLLIYAFIEHIWYGKPMLMLPGYLTVSILLLPAAELFSVFHPIFSNNGFMQLQFLKTSINFIYKWSILLLCAGGIFSIANFKKAVQFLLLMSIIVNCFGIYQMFARAFDLPFAWLETNNVALTVKGYLGNEVGQLSLRFENFYRATSFFSEPSYLAQFNTYVLTFLAVPFMRDEPGFFKSSRLNALIFICSILGLFLTFSMTGIFAISVVLFYIFAVEISPKKKNLALLLSSVLLMLITIDIIIAGYFNISVLGLFSQRLGSIAGFVLSIRTSYSTINGESFFGRWDNIKQGLEMFTNYPLSGIGAGCHSFYSKTHSIAYSDSIYAGIMGELGLPGISSYCLFLFLMFKQALSLSRSKEYLSRYTEDQKQIVTFLPYGVLIIIALSFTTYFWINWTFWVIVALIMAGINNAYRLQGHPILRIYLVDQGIAQLLQNLLNRANRNPAANNTYQHIQKH
jgi:hypothetical protein